MSYVVLALGALLSLCGAVAIFTGYPIIEVERGWASVYLRFHGVFLRHRDACPGLAVAQAVQLACSPQAGNGVTPLWRQPVTRTSNETRIEPSPGFASASSWGAGTSMPR